jgi:MFS family permease
MLLGGCLLLVGGATISIAAMETGTVAVMLLGTGVAGLGYGSAFLGAHRTVVALAPPSDRAGLIAAIFTVSYLSTGLPALIAGITAAQFGLHGTALVYSAAVAGLAAVAAASLFSRARPRPPQLLGRGIPARRRQIGSRFAPGCAAGGAGTSSGLLHCWDATLGHLTKGRFNHDRRPDCH